jgi:DNA-binding transcriptional LysR family regulator
MDERRLRAFLSVVDEGTVTAAAARLHVAQPSLSQTLRALERELAVELFHRAGRGLRLTAAGRELVGPARQALRALEQARATVAEVAGLQVGSLELTALATLAVDPLASLLGAFRRAHPGVLARVREPDSAAGVGEDVRAGAAELGLAHLPLAAGDLVARLLGEQELLVILSPGSGAGEGPLRAAALADLPLVVSPPGTSTRMLLEQALAAAGVAPRIAVETAAREAIVPLVLAGAGAALLPAALASEAERRGAVVRAPRPRITRAIGLLHRAGPLSPAARAFVRLAEEDAHTRGQVDAARRPAR